MTVRALAADRVTVKVAAVEPATASGTGAASDTDSRGRAGPWGLARATFSRPVLVDLLRGQEPQIRTLR